MYFTAVAHIAHIEMFDSTLLIHMLSSIWHTTSTDSFVNVHSIIKECPQLPNSNIGTIAVGGLL